MRVDTDQVYFAYVGNEDSRERLCVSCLAPLGIRKPLYLAVFQYCHSCYGAVHSTCRVKINFRDWYFECDACRATD